MDADGTPCKLCFLQGAFPLYSDEEQATTGEQFGFFDCDSTSAVAPSTATTPFDELSECLEHYQEEDCFHSSCTWCNTSRKNGPTLITSLPPQRPPCYEFQRIPTTVTTANILFVVSVHRPSETLLRSLAAPDTALLLLCWMYRLLPGRRKLSSPFVAIA